MDCSAGNGTIDISVADFGRYDFTTCPHSNPSTKQYCRNSVAAWKFIVDKCQSRKTCSVIHDLQTEELLGNPCPGVSKYIKVVYQCKGINSIILIMIMIMILMLDHTLRSKWLQVENHDFP